MPRSSSEIRWCAILVIFATFAVLTPVTIVLSRNQVESVNVTMEGLTFAPNRLSVRKGTVVTFDNQDVAPHTVTADDRSYDSGIIPPRDSFPLRVERSTTFHCEVHPTMVARILVSG